MKCGEIGCEIKATTRGYCGKHYHKRVRSGELAILRPMLGGTAMEKLLRHIQQEPDGCWKWTGCVGGHGYKNGLGYGVI